MDEKLVKFFLLERLTIYNWSSWHDIPRRADIIIRKTTTGFAVWMINITKG